MATTTTTTDTPKITHESIVRAMEMFEFPKTKTKGAAVAHHMTALIASWLNAGRIAELELSSNFKGVLKEATARILLLKGLGYSPDIEEAKKLVRQALGLPDED